MSRYYNLVVEGIDISLKEILEIVVDDFGWTSTSESEWKDKKNKNRVVLTCEGSLCGGMSEQEAHDRIYEKLKELNKNCKIRTRFTYMEDLPYEEYGDEIDE